MSCRTQRALHPPARTNGATPVPFAATAILAALALQLAGGCSARTYLSDRGRDAADIFTATLGVGSGAKVRAGPLQVALEENADLVGLRCGRFFLDGNGLVNNDERYAPFPLHTRTLRLPGLLPKPRRSMPPRPPADPEKKPSQRSATAGEPEIPYSGPGQWGVLHAATRPKRRRFGYEIFSHGVSEASFADRRYVMAHAPVPGLTVGHHPAHYTQIELLAGILFTVRIGVNPGELLDFVVGWFGADLYGDDWMALPPDAYPLWRPGRRR